MHWVVENGLHHTLDDTFREDRSPARRSAAVNLSLIRKIAYNILRISMYETEMTDVISEMMDHFCDHEELRGASIKIGPGKMGKDILNKTGKRGILDIVTGCPG